MLMGMANDLILVFLALELLSIPLYVLSGFARPRIDSEESAMKYFLLGAFASGFLVFGIALIYGATGTTALPQVPKGETMRTLVIAATTAACTDLGDGVYVCRCQGGWLRCLDSHFYLCLARPRWGLGAGHRGYRRLDSDSW